MQVVHHHTSSTCIEFTDVSFSYGGAEPALERVSFTVESGAYVGLIGPNGGGKTTALKLLLGLLKPTSGSVKIYGQEVSVARQERAHVGYVPQRAAQSDTEFPITVEEAVRTGRTARLGVGREFGAVDAEAVERALSLASLGELRNRRLGQLSGGQRQRVYIARALAGEPNVLVLDEPTVGVDQNSQEQFYSFLRKLHNEMGLTIILVSHDIDVVSKEVSSVVCINKRLVCEGPAHDVLAGKHMEDLYGSAVKRAYHGH
jgi:zinc transport system ATP-binding protein